MKEKMKTKCLAFLMCSVLLCFSAPLFAQGGSSATGRVVDKDGEGLIGATVTVVGSARGAITDENGDFEIANVASGTKLKVTYLGMEDKEQLFSGKPLTIVLEEQKNELDEVTIVGFGKQAKESVVSSISTVNVGDLRVPSSNLTTAFAGRIAGLISYQTSGEPGKDNASFFVRGVTSFGTGKVDPLILIDNIEVSTSDLAKLHPDDLQSFSILKDATATALYGSRGANGVIIVKTKEGKEGKARVNFRVEQTWQTPTSEIEMADAITYMNMANEAYSTRTGKINRIYPRSDIAGTAAGTYPVAYPNVDWMNLITKDVTNSQRANMSLSGGGKVARYYISGSFANDNGLLKTDSKNGIDNSIDYKKYTLHSNININVTGTTEMVIRLHGGFDDYHGPLSGGDDLYKKILKVSPVRFLPYYDRENTTYSSAPATHILYGNDNTATGYYYLNPYTEMTKGYNEWSSSNIQAQLELNQNLDELLKGLKFRALANTVRGSTYNMSRSLEPTYYALSYYDRSTNTPYLTKLNTNGHDYLSYQLNSKSATTSMYGEAYLMYDTSINALHNISVTTVGTARTSSTSEADNLIGSLPSRNLSLLGRASYNYDSRYFIEVTCGYNGSEKFDKEHRWGLFPAVGLGYLISNEKYFAGAKDIFSKLKLKYTYGKTGNDQIADTRFFYISEIEMNAGAGFDSGKGFGISRGGFSGMKGPNIKNYANPNITWEVSYKHNLGLELGLFNKVEILADVYQEHRVNILQERADIPVSIGLWSIPLVNVGEAMTRGGEVSVDYNHTFNKNFWISARGNVTFAHSTYEYYEESDYSAIGAPWKSKIGRTTKQQEGYIAERLFVDQAEIDALNAAAPGGVYQANVKPGDIKYKDLNGDGRITPEQDMRGIGYPTTPELQYGIGFSVGYKKIDVSAFFQGTARASFFVNPEAMMPFLVSGGTGEDPLIKENGLAKFIADDYWSETWNQDPYAKWPRLAETTAQFSNNLSQSTYWMYDNKFLRFKTLEVGYTLPDKLTKKMHVGGLRVYFSGENLLLWSSFKLWDVELGDNGLNYPLQRKFNVGVNLTL
jgi:TonB-linked SusC/RagA family outer membrane protein